MAKRRPSGDGMIRKRDDGHWEGRIVVGHKENGDAIFHYVSAKTQKALMEKLHRCIVEYDGAELTEDCRMTLGEWLDIWLRECAEPSVRPSTYAGYCGYAERSLKPYLGSKQISKVTAAMFRACIESCSGRAAWTVGRCLPPRSAGYTASCIRR